jgi:hypothetical protein
MKGKVATALERLVDLGLRNLEAEKYHRGSKPT